MDYTLSDIRAASGYNNCNDGLFGGGNGFGWLLAILLLGSGGFGWGNNIRGQAVTEADLCNANSFNDLKSGVRDISGQISSMNVGFTKGLCDMGYTIFGQFSQLEKALSQCCCENLRAIDSVKFDMANYAAATSQMFAAGIQSVKDMFRDYNEQNLRDQNMRNYIQSQLCGVPKYNLGTIYGAVPAQCFGYAVNNGGCCGGF